MRTHVKVLGYLYAALGSAVALFAVLGFAIDAIAGKFSQAGIAAIVLMLGIWWIQTGVGLLNFRASARIFAMMIAGMLMLGLNAMLLLFGGPPFSSSTAWIVFHVACICIGVYTLVVMLVPSSRSIFSDGAA